MRKTTALLALALIIVGAIAQTVPPESFGKKFAITSTAVTTTCGDTTKVRSTTAPKTYSAAASVAAGTGTAVVNVQGSMDGVSWETLGTITIPSTSATAAVTGSFPSNDHYVFVCGNVSTLSGSTPTLSLTAGY